VPFDFTKSAMNLLVLEKQRVLWLAEPIWV